MSFASRLLRPIADVRSDEVRRALLLAADLFVLLLAYYLLKTMREVLLLAAPGARAEFKTYASAAQGILLFGLSLAFGALAARVQRRTLLVVCTTFFALHLVLFDVIVHLATLHPLAVGVAFFVWLGCFNVLIVAQFWSFANDLYGEADGERIFPLVALGASLGGVAGAQLARPLARSIGAGHTLLVGAALLLLSLALALAIDREASAGRSAPPVVDSSGPALLRADRYLALIALLSLFKNLLNAFGEYLLDRRLLATAHQAGSVAAAHAYIAAFKSDYLTWASGVGLLVQLLVVSRVLRWFGVGRALLFLPVLVVVGYSTTLLLPTLGVVLAVKVGENGVDYSLQKTAEQALYLVTSRAAKYKVKAIVDTAIVRLGDVLAAALVALVLALGIPFLGDVGVALLLALACFAISIRLLRMHEQRAAERLAA